MKHPSHESGDPTNADGHNGRPLRDRPFSAKAASPTQSVNLRLVDSWAPAPQGTRKPLNPQETRNPRQAPSNQATRDHEARGALPSPFKPQQHPSVLNADAPPSLSATDPRWVLAQRAAETMEGQVLRPEKRERLVRLGKVMGLSPFDAHMVLAIVQDQARRGIPAESCPAAGIQQLALIAPPDHRSGPLRLDRLGSKPWLLAGVFIATELIVVAWWLTTR